VPLARAQPYLWFAGMQLFSLSSHVAGLLGMPRRAYTGDFLGAAPAERWGWLTDLSAAGGVVLFASSLCWLAVLAGTMLTAERGEPPPIEYAEPLTPTDPARGLWDRFALWTMAAVALIAIAYYQPLARLLSLERFGSRAFNPF
jgi:cytochrome c oxidase subunit 1